MRRGPDTDIDSVSCHVCNFSRCFLTGSFICCRASERTDKQTTDVLTEPTKYETILYVYLTGTIQECFIIGHVDILCIFEFSSAHGSLVYVTTLVSFFYRNRPCLP